MPTLNTKKVDDDSYRYDPFSEYHHQSEVVQEHEQEQEHVTKPLVEVKSGKEQLLKNIDDMFDGADFVFDIANKFFKRLGGK